MSQYFVLFHWQYFIVWMYKILFIQQLIGVCVFSTFSYYGYAAMNVHVQFFFFFFDMLSFFLAIYQGVELLGPVVILYDADNVECIFICLLTYFYFTAKFFCFVICFPLLLF